MGIPQSKVAKLISVPFHVIESQRNHERKETVGSKKAFKKARHFRKLVWTTLVPSKKRARQRTNRGKKWKTTNLKALLSWNQLRMIEQNFREKKTGRPKTTPANIIFLWAIQKWLNSSLSGSSNLSGTQTPPTQKPANRIRSISYKPILLLHISPKIFPKVNPSSLLLLLLCSSHCQRGEEKGHRTHTQ